MEAQLSELNDELETVQKDMADMQAATSKATDMREKEKLENLRAIKEYQDAQVLLKNAMGVLKDFYDKQDKFTLAQTDSDSNQPETIEGRDEYKAKGASSGVIGLLEIAVEDFANL